VLLAVFAAREAARRASGRLRAAAVVAGFLALTVPAAVASAPLLLSRTEVGEVAAVERACRAFGPKDVVLIVDVRGGNEWPQVLRGVCGVPVATLAKPYRDTVRPFTSDHDMADRTTVDRLVARAEAAGSRPILASGDQARPLRDLGANPRQLVNLVIRQDEQTLTQRPRRTKKITISLWTAPARDQD
jgi:hypothetical protein